MSIRALVNAVYTAYRTTAFVLDAIAAAASHTADRQPSIASLVEVSISGGTDNTGTVTISGTINGVPGSETLTFTGAKIQQTTKAFSAISGITTSGFTGEAVVPTIAARAIGKGGQPDAIRYSVITDWNVYRERGGMNWRQEKPGSMQDRPIKITADYRSDYEPREGDIIVENTIGERLEITGTDPVYRGPALHHMEVDAKRLQR